MTYQYTHQTGACGTNSCTVGEAPTKCPSGHSGPFHHTLIGLPRGAEWWFHCHHDDSKEDGWCDERFPGRVRELLTLLVRPEIYRAAYFRAKFLTNH